MFALFTTLLPVAPIVRCEDANRPRAQIEARIPAGYTVDPDGTVRRPNGTRYGQIIETGRLNDAGKLAKARELRAAWSQSL
jgi:hypothetical protein